MRNDEQSMEMYFGYLPDDPTPFSDQVKEAIRSLNDARDNLETAHERFSAFTETLRNREGGEQALRELGIILEKIGIAKNVITNGL